MRHLLNGLVDNRLIVGSVNIAVGIEICCDLIRSGKGIKGGRSRCHLCSINNVAYAVAVYIAFNNQGEIAHFLAFVSNGDDRSRAVQFNTTVCITCRGNSNGTVGKNNNIFNVTAVLNFCINNEVFIVNCCILRTC